MRLAEPGWLLLLILVPLPWLWARARPRLAWPSLNGFGRSQGFARIGQVPALLRAAAIVGMAVALARPQTVGGRTRIAGRGVAIVVALDNSSSMNAADFPTGPETSRDKPPVARLDAARETVARFVAGRPDDLIGLVVFANYPDLATQPTIDHAALLDAIRAVRPARPGDDGTNLGDAIALGIDALRASSPRKKVLILLTDGRNSPAVPRPLDPEEAATLARALGVRLHTIAIGRPGGIARAVEPRTGLPIASQVEGPDLPFLERLAELGGGQAFAAADADALDRVFRDIDALEKSPVRGEIRTRYHERYVPWLVLALAALALDRLLSAGRLRRLP
jgi:Ca-activated chloride channel family protein